MKAGRPADFSSVTAEATEICRKVSVGQVWLALLERLAKVGPELQLIPVF